MQAKIDAKLCAACILQANKRYMGVVKGGGLIGEQMHGRRRDTLNLIDLRQKRGENSLCAIRNTSWNRFRNPSANVRRREDDALDASKLRPTCMHVRVLYSRHRGAE